MGILDKVGDAIGAVTDAVSSVFTGSDAEEAQNNQPATNGNSVGQIRIQYYRSAIGFPKTQKQVVRSLGITKLNQIVERPDTAAMRGVVNKVSHLLRIVE